MVVSRVLLKIDGANIKRRRRGEDIETLQEKWNVFEMERIIRMLLSDDGRSVSDAQGRCPLMTRLADVWLSWETRIGKLTAEPDFFA